MPKKLKLDDKKIRDFVPEFTYRDKEGKVKQKILSYTPFDVAKKTRLKGLKLRKRKDDEDKHYNKYFVVHYKLKGLNISKYYSLGKFIFGKYGVREVSDELTDLNKSHTDNKGHWISCPLEAKQKAKTIITKEEAIERRKEPVSRVAEAYCRAGFPRATFGGTLVANVIGKRARVLIGYNLRKKHLTYYNDNNGNGHVGFKVNKQTRVAPPSNWDDLFKKFPSGFKIERDKNLNPNKCISNLFPI